MIDSFCVLLEFISKISVYLLKLRILESNYYKPTKYAVLLRYGDFKYLCTLLCRTIQGYIIISIKSEDQKSVGRIIKSRCYRFLLIPLRYPLPNQPGFFGDAMLGVSARITNVPSSCFCSFSVFVGVRHSPSR